MKLKILSVWLIAFTIISCTYDVANLPPLTQTEMFDCHQLMIWDEGKIRNSLLGTWSLEYVKCESSGAFIQDDITIEFKSDSTFMRTENGIVTQNTHWSLLSSHGYYSILPNPHVSQLYGIVFICDNRMGIFASHFDLCDQFFVKDE